MGSPGYMSPEQFLGTEIDARGDIYSVGIITYELLTGRRPFTGNNAEVMRQALNERPQSPSEFNPKISVQLDWAVQKALAKKREERFQNAQEFSDAIVQGVTASLRQAAREPAAVSDDQPTDRIDPKLVQAARMLAGMQLEKKAGDSPTLPATQTQMQAAPAPAADSDVATETSIGKRARILFVDDEERILTALRSIFRHNYRVFTATNGREAIEIVTKFRPHVVVSDQRMPEMTGVELLRQVKIASPQAVRMLLTGYSDLAAIVGSLNDGEVYRFISKPWDNEEIQKTIAEAMAIALELAEIAATPPIVPDRMEAAVLVIEPSGETFRAVTRLVGGACPVHHSTSLDDGLAQLQARETAVIIADIAKQGEDTLTAFKLIKQLRPEILVIVLAEAADSELVIELINQAQVFRFINKPATNDLLRQHTQAALTRYQSFKQNPHLARQHKVAEPPAGAVSQKILERVKSLKSWF
jgi:serine/threonine-protein kinase